nr:RepB family protein [Lactococcus lactis]RQE06334.1 RepB family protein [Lactococcus lactis]
MSENYKTIKELADELGVSKTYIEKIIRVVNIHSELLKKKNRFFLNIKQQEIIKNYLDKEPPTQAPTADVVFLQNELVKRGVEIDKLHELLDQQQRLALQDKKLLEEYKAENDRLKVLKMPSQDTKENQSQEEVQTIKKQMEALNDKIKGQEQLNNQVSKKWYQFWK